MKCYIYNPKAEGTLPNELDKSNTLFYPENRMTTNDLLRSGIPADFNIVTDSPFLIPLYKTHEVFIWKNGEWTNPELKTYGCSYSHIIEELFNYEYTIPQAIVSGKGVTNVMGYKIK